MTLPRVILKRRRARPFFSRHPWVFSGAIDRLEGDPQPGAEVLLLSETGEFIARGLYNPHSKIRVRLYSWNEAEPLDERFWSKRLDRALALRRRLFKDGSPSTAHRLVYSEADGLSGLIADRYGDRLLLQLTSLALATRREMLVGLLKAKLQPAGIWLRTEKGIRETEGLDVSDGPLDGPEPPQPLVVAEHGLRYHVDVVRGQKTGFYLDHRDNRAAASRYVEGHRVLDLFCYSGAFGLAALKLGGAAEVVGIDTSERALALARSNAELNGVAGRCRFEKSNVFDALERLRSAGECFDTVILDPPKLARHRAGLKKALQSYHALNRLAVDVLNPDGVLVTCSCSGLVGRDAFEGMLAEVGLRTDRPLQILEARGQAPDHPTSVYCSETSYLKCSICRAP